MAGPNFIGPPGMVSWHKKSMPKRSKKNLYRKNFEIRKRIEIIWINSNSGSREGAESLINEGVNVNITNEYGRTPLHLAAFKGHESIAKILIQNGADINPKDHLGLTPIFMAAGTGNIK